MLTYLRKSAVVKYYWQHAGMGLSSNRNISRLGCLEPTTLLVKPYHAKRTKRKILEHGRFKPFYESVQSSYSSHFVPVNFSVDLIWCVQMAKILTRLLGCPGKSESFQHPLCISAQLIQMLHFSNVLCAKRPTNYFFSEKILPHLIVCVTEEILYP